MSTAGHRGRPWSEPAGQSRISELSEHRHTTGTPRHTTSTAQPPEALVMVAIQKKDVEFMGNRRQPSEQFLRRLRGRGKPSKAEISEKRPSWIRKLKASDYWLWGEFIGLIGVVLALVAFYIDIGDRKLQREAIRIDLEDRETQRISQAWQLVTQVAPGNSGKGPAMEYLNRQGVSLTGIDLSAGNDQSGSFLTTVDLSGADLVYANLAGANMRGANLPNAALYEADLSSTNLDGADLSGANLTEANLLGADLTMTDLSGADLSHAINFDQIDLETACGDEKTQLPQGLTIATCIYTDVSGADLRNVLMSQWELFDKCGDETTQLPKGFTIKPCPDKSRQADRALFPLND